MLERRNRQPSDQQNDTPTPHSCCGLPALPPQLDDPIGGYQRAQARLQQVRDRLGPLFMDLKGGRGARLAAGWAGLACMAARGALLGAFAGERRHRLAAVDPAALSPLVCCICQMVYYACI
jgi:hypothetical protein